jgi:anaphase-promoting complex subunit 8
MATFTSQIFQRNPSEFRNNIYKALRNATFELQDRGLKQSAAWASDLLQTVSSDAFSTSHQYNENAPDPSSSTRGTRSSSRIRSQQLHSNDIKIQQVQQQPKSDAYLLAKSYFDLAEYRRSAYTLKHVETPSSDSLAYYLKIYATFLSGEKRKEEELMETKDPLERCQVVNKELKNICSELERFYPDNTLLENDARDTNMIFEEDGTTLSSSNYDGYILHLYGVVLKKCGDKDKARRVLSKSCTIKPFNWSAWLDLASISTGMSLHIHCFLFFRSFSNEYTLTYIHTYIHTYTMDIYI